MTKIFISHSTKDTEFARQIAQALTEVGITVWIDVADIPAGMKWSTAIQNGLNECDAMIVILSPDSMDSNNVEDEWQYYLDKRKKLFPLRWKPTDVHFQLSRIQYVDFHEQNFAAAFVRLCAELQRQGLAIDGARGQMNVIRSDSTTPPPTPRPSVDRIQGEEQTLPSVKGILPEPFEWCAIPAGKVTLVQGGYVPEGGQTFVVPAFAIAKYPITNAQYEAFVKAKDGYANAAWWEYSEDDKKWHARNEQPPQTTFPGDDRPRTALTRYEAVAFCRWLNAKIGLQSRATLQITLPTEQQWQRAAQGDDGRTYPWGSTFDPKKANTLESGIFQTTPVTQYPQGASPYGVLDMSGNVWEWCLTEWHFGTNDAKGTYVARVMRGGAFDLTQSSAACAFRKSAFPDDDLSYFGVRLVVPVFMRL